MFALGWGNSQVC